MDVNLIWLDSYTIGIESIDDDHKKILELMRDIMESITARDYVLSAERLEELLSHAMSHFSLEEDYLRKHGYPDLEEHIEYHEKLLLQAKAVKGICESAREKHDLERCFQGLAQFLVDDIIVGDLNFVPFLSRKGLI